MTNTYPFISIHRAFRFEQVFTQKAKSSAHELEDLPVSRLHDQLPWVYNEDLRGRSLDCLDVSIHLAHETDHEDLAFLCIQSVWCAEVHLKGVAVQIIQMDIHRQPA